MSETKDLVTVPPAEMLAGNDLITSMYEALHAEINQRLELRQGVLTFTLLVAASLFGLGLQSWVNSLTALCYPILGLFLACVWEQHDLRIGQLSAYLRHLEDRQLGAGEHGWERWRRQHFPRRTHHIEVPARGIFVASEMLAIVIGLARFQPTTGAMIILFVLLLLLDVTSIILTWFILVHKRDHHPQP